MNKLTFLLLVSILLTACQPAVTPQPTTVPQIEPSAPTPASVSVETPAGSINDMFGVWWFTQAGLKLEIKTDGTYRVFSGSETIDEGNYTFDSGKITWVTGHPTCGDQPATYEAYLTKQDGKPVWLRLQIVGSDPCHGRIDTTKGKAKFQNP
jgi:hypothetical protein